MSLPLVSQPVKPERQRNLGLAAIGVSLFVTGFWLGSIRSRAALPVYGGKTAHEWFFGVDGNPGRDTTMKAASVAFKAMGTNCVPFLLNEVRRRETGSQRFYRWIYPRFPSVLRARLRPPLSPYYQLIALFHLDDMQSKLDFAASDLMKIVPRIQDDKTREHAYFLVEHLAIRLDDVAKKKACFVGFLGDRAFGIQLNAAIMLSRVDSSFTNGIPILINAVTNTSLMNATFLSPSLFPRWKPSMATSKQRTAFEALRQVAPLLAERYCLAE